MQTFATPNGKELTLERCPRTAHLKVKFVGGGEVPAELAGLYTAEVFAEKDIRKYLETKATKDK